MITKLLSPNGMITDYPPKDSCYTLAELQKAVHGYIQVVPLSPVYFSTGLGEDLDIDAGYVLVVNEEGKLKHLPTNPIATLISGLLPHDFVVGEALLCPLSLLEGEEEGEEAEL